FEGLGARTRVIIASQFRSPNFHTTGCRRWEAVSPNSTQWESRWSSTGRPGSATPLGLQNPVEDGIHHAESQHYPRPKVMDPRPVVEERYRGSSGENISKTRTEARSPASALRLVPLSRLFSRRSVDLATGRFVSARPSCLRLPSGR